jgi:PAS domain S-box-containing protein
MNLRTKTFLIILGVFITAFLIMTFLLNRYITNSSSQEENQLILDKLEQVQSSLDDSLDNMDRMVMDWAEWDDTYQYMQDQNTAYANSNLTDSSFFTNQLNFIALVDISGKIIYSQMYDLINGIPLPIPDDLQAYLSHDSKLLIHNDNENGANGIISVSNDVMLIVSHPILTSHGSGPTRGALIFGRYLDSVQLGRLPGIAKLNPQGYPINDPQMPSDFRNVIPELLSGTSNMIVRVVDDNSITGYTIRRDINGQPAYILKISNSRVIYAQSQYGFEIFSLEFIIFGLILILVILLVLERMVISRVAYLSKKVTIIGQKGDLSSRVSLTGKDELSNLANNINGMLGNLEHSRKLQKESETFNYALLQDSPNPIEVMNPDGSIRYVNPALEKVTGYTQTQLIGRKPPYPWLINANIQQYTEELHETLIKGAQIIEVNYQRPNGELYWVEITSTVIRQDGEVKYIIANWVDITERKKADEALRQSENRFRELAELLPELVFEIDLNGQLTFVNRVAFSVFGYFTEECKGLKLVDLIAPEDKEIATRNIQRIISGKEIGNTEHMAVRKDGSRFPTFIHATSFKNNQGKVMGLRGIMVDITSQKEIEAELRASEEFSSSLLSNAPNPIIVSNMDSSIRYINPALEVLTGYSSVELIGKSAPHPWWLEEQSAAFNDKSLINQNPSKKGTEKCYRKKNGEQFWVTTIDNPFIENGKIQYYIGNWVDITERKRTEDALRESEAFSSSLRDNSPYPIMVVNPDKSIKYVNAALERLSGFSASELIGQKPPYSYWPEEQMEKFKKGLSSGLESSHKDEALFRKKSGESFYVDITSTPIKENGVTQYLLSIWVDITAQKIASEQLERLYQREKSAREALQAEIRSRTEYTRALVHELKTPLTPILASSELLVEELTQEPLLGLAKNVHRGAENMNRRVDELLDLARGELGMLKVNLNPVDPEKLLYEIVKYMEPVAKNGGHTLKLDLPNKLPVVMADDDRVHQILFNLISNSIKYSSAGCAIKISAREEGDNLIIEVQDTGRGMTLEEQEKLFQPYYRIEGREHLSGLGLGLALSKNLIELQHGRIWATSQKGVGSTFSFSLPTKEDIQIENIYKSGGK